MTPAGDLAARIASLSPEQRAALARRLRAEGADGGPGATGGGSGARPALGSIPRREPTDEVPVTFAQWRLWFLEQFTPGTNAWNTPAAVRLRGPLDVDALRRALSLVVERHATLRTNFVAPGGKPAPVVREAAPVEIPVAECAPALDAEAEIRRWADEETGRPFDLESDLMVRARLLRLGVEDHALVLVVHHIACDGWSKGLLLEELSMAYSALVAGEEPELPELPIEYADFAVWQRRWLSGQNLERLNAYWRERLDGHAPALELPTDRPRPRTPSFRGAVEWVGVPQALAGPVLAVGREQAATPFMTLLSAFKVLLHAHSGQDDVLVGSPAAMRDRPELQRLVGFFVNTLVYRTNLSGQPSFREVVSRVRETALGVYGHQELPFEKIVEAVKPPRDASRNPLVQVNLRVEGREPELRLRGLEATPIAVDPGIARFDLAIELGATDDGYAGYLEYDTSLFDPATAAAYAADFRAILDAVGCHPDHPLSDLEPVRDILSRRTNHGGQVSHGT